jgi:hypothetical protein
MIPNNIFEQTLMLINNTSANIFLSGKAGTGKTTFLKSLHNRTYKKFIVTAPTGVAAINANGITLHSLFNLPMNVILPGDKKSLENIRLDFTKRTLIEEIELLVIDEVSMLRADLLDSIDYILKTIRKTTDKAFGGIQILFIGDLYQLSPVVKTAEWENMKDFYQSPFFIDARILAENPPTLLELDEVFRQSDTKFIELLNKIRNNTINDQEINQLNLQLVEENTIEITNNITLTTHNQKADVVNNENLSKQDGKEFRFEAIIDGSFDSSSYPVEKTIVLKVGAMVMLLKNDTSQNKKYFNGKIGMIKGISEGEVSVVFNDNEMIKVERDIWLNTEYNYDHENNQIAQTEKGSFQQFPLRLAWAITIHKSQGLSFDSAVIDVSGAFSAGHVYVALSRVRSLQGLKLKSPLNSNIISVTPRVTKYYQSEAVKLDARKFHHDASIFIEQFLKQSFDWTQIILEITSEKDQFIPIHTAIIKVIQNQHMLMEKFKQEIKPFFEQPNVDLAQLNQRVNAAVDYFIPQIDTHIIRPLKAFHRDFSNDLNYKRYINFSKSLLRASESEFRKLKIIKRIMPELVLGEAIGSVFLKIIPQTNNIHPLNKNAVYTQPDTPTEQISLQFFEQGLSIDEISAKRNLPKATIEKHLTAFLETGEIQIDSLISLEHMQLIQAILNEDPTRSLAYIKQQMGNTLSFGQINAGMVYHNLKHQLKITTK